MSHVSIIGTGNMGQAISTVVAKGGNTVELIGHSDADKPVTGDIIYTPPDEWHWHGAAPDHFMTHISMTEGVGEDAPPEVEWGPHVTDEE